MKLALVCPPRDRQCRQGLRKRLLRIRPCFDRLCVGQPNALNDGTHTRKLFWSTKRTRQIRSPFLLQRKGCAHMYIRASRHTISPGSKQHKSAPLSFSGVLGYTTIVTGDNDCVVT